MSAPPDELNIDTDEAARRLGVSRERLDAMVTEAPPDLPGSPVNVACGDAKRRRLRWPANRLAEWFSAYGRWRAVQDARAKTVVPRSRRRTASMAKLGAKTGKLTMAELNGRGKR